MDGKPASDPKAIESILTPPCRVGFWRFFLGIGLGAEVRCPKLFPLNRRRTDQTPVSAFGDYSRRVVIHRDQGENDGLGVSHAVSWTANILRTGPFGLVPHKNRQENGCEREFSRRRCDNRDFLACLHSHRGCPDPSIHCASKTAARNRCLVGFEGQGQRCQEGPQHCESGSRPGAS